MDDTSTPLPDDQTRAAPVEPVALPAPEPVQAVPVPISDLPPAPAPEDEKPVETPEPESAVTPAITEPQAAPASDPAEVPAPIPPQELVPEPSSPTMPIVTEPNPAPPVVQGGVPAAVLALSDDELRMAAAHYLRKNQAAISQKGVQARQATMQQNLEAITAYIRTRGSAQIPRMARELYLSPGLTSHYLQILVKQNKIKADGWAKSRRYFT